MDSEQALIAALETVKRSVEVGDLGAQTNTASEQALLVFESGVA